MGKNLQSAGRLIAVVALVVGLLAPGLAHGQPANARYQALTHFKQAEAYMKAEAYADAVAEYQAAYRAVPKPGFLFNIGLAYESAGEKKKAVEHYERYLELEPKGRASEEARARAAKLKPEIEAEEAAAAEQARRESEQERHKLVAKSHAGLARTHLEAKQYSKAAEELRSAYREDPDPEYVYQLAEVLRIAGNRAGAVIEYDLYRELAPEGPNAPEAIRQSALLKQELEEQAKPPPPQPPPPVTITPPAPPADAVEEEEDEGINWWWVGAGAAAVATGLILDLAPNTARNDELDGTDFLPLPFYAAGITFVAIGVF